LIDVLDHVLDKGIVIDAWVRVSLMGLQLATVEARIVVASIQTYLEQAAAIARVAPASQMMGVAVASDSFRLPPPNVSRARGAHSKRLAKR
jgi:hypothetical protein